MDTAEDTFCTCDSVEHTDHTCPYSSDVHNDDEYTCTCCPYCTNECAMDI